MKTFEDPPWSGHRAKKRREWERQCELEAEARRQEEWRKRHLSMYDRIEESDASDDVKDILHRMAEKLGMEP